MQEMTRGKHPRPKWKPAVLLGVDERGTGQKRVVQDPQSGKVRAHPQQLLDLARRGGIGGLGLVVRGAASAQAERE